MTVTIKLFATLGKYLPPGSTGRAATVEASEGATVGDVLARFGVPRQAAHLIMINGMNQSWNAPLKDGDTLTVFPPVAGG
ncbi:MAG: MoaD/ThiS family protein [Armatimonadetes bacterium]|nr:MoaD/ThiS family protein [Armatimonadota bacterium]